MVRKITLSTVLIIVILFLGFLYKLYLTSNGNFIFNMDNARDLVDVREMIVLQKPRLIGPTTAIEGVYTGPAWYYLLAVPLFISAGDPYSAIILQIILWATGGYFLLKICSRFGVAITSLVGITWIASSFINLSTSYSFNPNPVTLLTPMFLYFLERLIVTNSIKYSLIVWTLAGLFFNFEINFGIFTPIIILSAIILSKHGKYLKSRQFWLGAIPFGLLLLPQILFDVKHNFIMFNSMLNYLSAPKVTSEPINPLLRLPIMAHKYFGIFTAIFMNSNLITKLLILAYGIVFIKLIKSSSLIKNTLFLITSLYILIPFISYVFMPVTVNSWHLGPIGSAAILMAGYLLYLLSESRKLFKASAFIVGSFLLILSMQNILSIFNEHLRESTDQSVYANEIKAIDYVYSKAGGMNFKVYTYLPSVYDYPYQYLFWWYGNKKYGYIPEEYAYLPNVPQYIASKSAFSLSSNKNSSNLIFLIKEPDSNGFLPRWEGHFNDLVRMEKTKVGPIEIEVKKQQLFDKKLPIN